MRNDVPGLPFSGYVIQMLAPESYEATHPNFPGFRNQALTADFAVQGLVEELAFYLEEEHEDFSDAFDAAKTEAIYFYDRAANDKGRHGWTTATPEHLSELFWKAADENDTVNAMTYLVMLFSKGESIVPRKGVRPSPIIREGKLPPWSDKEVTASEEISRPRPRSTAAGYHPTEMLPHPDPDY